MFLTDEDKQLELQKNSYWLKKQCSVCNGRGTVLTPKNLSAMCMCQRRARRNVRLLDWGFPRKFLSDDWTMRVLAQKPYYAKLQQYIYNFEQNYEQGKGIYFWGEQARGKTTCECAVGKEISLLINPYTFDKRLNYSVGFSMLTDIVKMYFDHNPNLNNFLYKSDLLIIDNVGVKSNQYEVNLLENILRKRNNDCKPTIISSNFSVEELQREYNMDIHDFIVQNCEIIYISGDNYRTTTTVATSAEDDNVF